MAKQHAKLDEAIAGLDRVITAVVSTPDKLPSNAFYLTKDTLYQDVLRDVFSATKQLRHISQREIERRFDDVLLAVLRARRAGISAEEATRLGKDRATQLLTLLKSQPDPWFIHMRVNNVAHEGLPFTVGNVTLCVADSTNLEDMQRPGHAVIAGTKNTEKEKEAFKDRFRDWIQREFATRTVASVHVEALDADAAKRLALESLRAQLDLLNYCRSALPPSLPSWAYTDTDAMPRLTVALLYRGPHEQTVQFNMPFENIGTLEQLKVGVLQGLDAEAAGVSQLLSLASKAAVSKVEEKVVTAARLAGAALTRHRRDHAFLLNVIALESLFLGEPKEDADGSLGYRLRLGCARLLGSDPAERRRIFRQVRDVYARRSAIVHRGDSDVPEAEVDAAEELIRRSLQRILTTPELLQQRSLVGWLDEQILS